MKLISAIIFSSLFVVVAEFAYAQITTPVDYSKITSSQIDGLEHHYEFLDEQTNKTRRVINTKTLKGVEVQISIDGKTEFVRDGVFYTYRDSILTKLVTYRNGKKHGVSEKYSNGGVVTLRVMHEDNKKEGPWEKFSDTNVLLAKGVFGNDMKQGVETRYEESTGYKRAEVDYVDDERDGKHIQYVKGKKYSTTIYKKEIQIGKTVYH